MKYISDFNNFSESVKYHIDKNLNILESVYRIESDAWLDLVNESRELYKNGKIELSEDDKWLVEDTLVGQKDIFGDEEVLLDVPFEVTNEAEYHGKKVNLNRPFRTPGQSKKFAVYTKNAKGSVVKVRFGDPHLSVKNNNPKRAKSFRARHHCENPGPKWKAKYWSCNISRYRKLVGLKSSRAW